MKLVLTQSILVLLLLLIATVTAQNEIPPLLKDVAASKASPDVKPPRGELTLRQALKLALQHNPQLTVYSLEIRTREAAALQAALWPNPELTVDVENFAGSGALSAFKSNETTISVGQLFELAGKRQKRARVAGLAVESATYDYRAKQLDVFTRVVMAFNHVLASQQFVELNLDLLTLAQEFKENIVRRVKAGRLSPVELSRADVEVANARISLLRSQKTLTAARLGLASIWGATQASFSKVSGNMENVTAVPRIDRLMNRLTQNPDLARWQVIKKQRLVEQNLARAMRIPDPVINAGWRKLNESGSQAFVAGLSIPLPFFNRNQGAIQETTVRLKQSAWQERFVRLKLQTLLKQKYQTLLAAYESLQSLKNEIIPQARNAFATINDGYQQGKFGFLDVLDARRTLFASREAYLRNLKDYHRTRAQIERLIGQSLANVK